MTKIFLIFIYISLAANIFAQKYDWYDSYDITHGMSNNYVDCIFEDSRGYIWIGTWDGLNRYDGFNFKQYKSDYTDTTFSITGNWIFSIFEDKQQNLWICTNNGLSRYNYTKDNFEIISFFYGFAVNSIKQCNDNYLWIGTINGLYKYDYNNNKVLGHFLHSDSNSENISNDIRDIIINKQQNLWIATNNNGLYYFNNQTNKAISYRIENTKQPLPSNKIRTITLDTENRLWIGTFDNGIAILDIASGKITLKQHYKNDLNSIGSNGISKLFCDTKGNVWVCCQNGYLNKYNKADDNFIRYQYNAYTNTSLKTKSISYIYEDKVGNYWIGTHGNGVACLNKYKNQFKTYSVMPNLHKTLPENKISSFLQLSDGKIAIGTDGGGFCIFDAYKETFETYSSNNGLMSDAITNLTKGANADIWISTWNGGISLFNYTTKNIKNYTHDYKNENSIIFNNIKDICFNDDTLWIATHGEGVALFDIKGKQFISYKNNNTLPFDLKIPTWVNSILRDSKGRFWIATSVFLYCYDGKKLKSYSMDGNNPKSLSGNQVFGVFEDSKHNIWIITDGGIDTYNETDDSFERHSVKNNFPKNAKAIIEDDNNNIWISTGTSLVLYNLQENTVNWLTQNDGLPKNDFIHGAAYKLNNGSLLFGGTNGFLMFHPDSLQYGKNIPKVKFSNLYIDYQHQTPSENSEILRKYLNYADTIKLPYSKKVLAIDIVGIDFTNPQALTFQYQIQGLNSEWINLEKERRITLPTLSPGTYVLNIKALKSNDLVSDNQKLVIIILPAWWQTRWFMLISLLGVVGLIFMFLNYRIQKIKNQNKRLEQTVSERTSELVIANKELKELNDTKNKLFSIIAHDLKNPISVLIGFSTLLKENFKTLNDTKKQTYITQITSSSKNIFHQLEQLLNWAMAQSNRLNHNPENIDLSIIVHEATQLLSDMFTNKEIKCNISITVSHTAYADAGMTSAIFRNIITNALKFTNKGGQITVLVYETNNMIEVSIADTGIGMTQEQQSKLFNITESNSTYRTNNEKGTGLGLVICKDFVEKNGGTIRVESKINEGTKFIFTLPLGVEYATNQCIDTPTESLIDENKTKNTNENTDKPVLLIVEDIPNMAEFLKDSLQNNFEILIASDGKEGLEKCRKFLPDIIVSDVSMPEMDGEEMCLAIKSDPLTNYIPLILLTARNKSEQQIEGLRKGADDYIYKPFELNILKEKINTILKNRELYRNHLKQQIICEPNADLPISQDDIFLQNALKLIEANLAETQLTVEFLAKELGMSRAQLFRKFKAIIGQAPVEFIKTIKLRHAAKMLKTGNWRVSEVAYSVGFSDPQYFSNCFQKEYGVAPSLYGKK